MNRLDTLTPPTDVDPRQPEEFNADLGGTPNPHGGVENRGVASKTLNWSRMQKQSGESGGRINVSQSERGVSVGVGAALIGLGLLRGKLSGLALAGVGALVINRGVTGHCGVYEKAGVNTAAGDGPADPTALYEHGVKIEEAVTVNRPAEDLYGYWRNLTNMPKFMPHVERVDVLEGGRSHWVNKGPAGVKFEYDAETIADEPGRLISWRSTGAADVTNAGSVRFIDAPGGKGTEVRLNVEYLPPAGFIGAFGSKVLKLFGQAPQNDVRQSLRQFKQLMEAGEITTNTSPRAE